MTVTVGQLAYTQRKLRYHSNADLPCTDNDKHGLTHKLTYRMYLLTVNS